MSDGPWRVGGKVKLNVYRHNQPICQCHNDRDAAMIVRAMNLWEMLRARDAQLWEQMMHVEGVNPVMIERIKNKVLDEWS